MNMHAQPQRTLAETALIDAFGERLSLLPGDGAVMVKRDDAIEAIKHGLPTRRIESWHYTDLRRLLTSVPAFEAGAVVKALAPVLEGSAVLPVLNGVSQTKLPEIEGVTVQRLSELAVFYGVPVSELLPDPRPSSAVTTNTKIVLNLESLGSLPADEAGPLARYASTIQAQRHDYNGKVLSIRTEYLKSLAIIYDMSPDELTSRLIEWGVLSPGMEAIADLGPDDDEADELDPHWERRRSPR